MKTLNNHDEYYTPIQMKIPVDLEKIIEISDPSKIVKNNTVCLYGKRICIFKKH